LGVIGIVAEVVLPLRNLLDFVEEENAFSLGLADWLHDPEHLRVRLKRLFLELLVENGVFGREVEGDGEEVIPLRNENHTECFTTRLLHAFPPSRGSSYGA
jgi:hypothetical protein